MNNLWSSNIDNGFPIFADPANQTFNFLFIIISKLFLGKENILIFIISLFILFLGIYLLAKSYKISVFGSLIASLFLINSANIWIYKNDPLYIQTISLFPLIIYFVKKILDTGKLKFIILTSLGLAWQIMTGGLQIVLITSVTILAYFLFTCLFNKTPLKKNLKILLLFLFIIFFSFCLAAVKIVPMAEFLNQSTYPHGLPFLLAVSPDYQFRDLFSYLAPLLKANKTGFANFHYLGLLPIILLIFTIIFNLKKKLFFFLFILLALLFSFGKNSPFYPLFTIAPFNNFSNPGNYMIISDLFICLIAGSFVDFMCLKFRQQNHKLLIKTIIVFLFIVDFYYTRYKFFPKINGLVNYAPKYCSLIASSPNNAEDKFVVLNNSNDNFPLIWIGNDINFVFCQSTHNLIKSFFVHNLLRYSMEKRDNQYYPTAIFNKAMQLTNIRLVISDLPLNNNDNYEFIKEINIEGNKYSQYRFKPFFSSMRFANQITNISSLENFLDKFKKITLQANDIFLETKDKYNTNNSSHANPNNIKIEENRNDYLKLRLNTFGKEFIVIDKLYYPGWQASINNEPAKIIPVNLNQMAIYLPNEGEQEVILNYNSKSFILGSYISIISLILALAGLLLFGRKSFEILRIFPYRHNS